MSAPIGPACSLQTQNWLGAGQIRQWQVEPRRIPSRIHIRGLIYSIHSTFLLVQIVVKPRQNRGLRVWWADCTIRKYSITQDPLMPQEISVSYQEIKSKVYRLIDSLVVGEKSEAEVQESVRRWWALIHPADRPIAQKYLQLVLGRSNSALSSMEVALLSATGPETMHSPVAQMAGKRMGLLDRGGKEPSSRPAV